MSDTVYRALDRDRSETRTLQVDRFIDSDCRVSFSLVLHHVSLKESPRYTALSYTWNSNEECKDIQLNESTVKITANLHAAIQTLYEECGVTTVWIDALCINQKDIPERNYQVSQMTAIYQQAEKVYVWLGPEADDSNLAISRLDQLGQKVLQVPGHPLAMLHVPMYTLPEEDKHFAHLEHLTKELETNGDITHSWMRPILRLLTRPWWLRVWVFQEFVVASNVTFLCGQKSLLWDKLEACIDIFLHYSYKEAFLKHTGQKLTIPSTVLSFFSSRKLWQFWGHIAPFSVLLCTTGDEGCQAHDPRDIVFTRWLLALEDSSDALKIDYALSVVQVFTEATRYILQGKQSQIERIFATSQRQKKIRGLPSWVPDWTTTSVGRLTHYNTQGTGIAWSHFEYRSHFHVYYGRSWEGMFVPAQLPSTVEEGMLWCQGWAFSTITAVSQPLLSHKTPRTKKLVDLKAVSDWCDYLEQVFKDAYHTQETNLRKLLYKTVFVGHVSDHHVILPNTAEYGEFFSHDMDEEFFPKQLLDEALQLLSRVYVDEERIMFSTADGLLGIARSDVQIGDKVCLFAPQFDTIFVLRPVQGCFELRGEAYIEDVYSRQLFPKRFGNLSRIPLEPFHLQ